MNKSDAEALLRQGIEFYDLGRYQEAIIMFDRALALYPNLSKAYYFKGIATHRAPRDIQSGPRDAGRLLDRKGPRAAGGQTVAGQTYADPAVPCPGSPLPVTIVSVMSGPVTHMGLAEMRSQHCIVGQNPDGSLLVSGSAVMRAANGDEIHGAYTGSMYGFSPAPAPGTLMTAGGMMLLAGGTGRFADASGQLAWAVEVKATGTGVEAIQGSLEGSIVY